MATIEDDNLQNKKKPWACCHPLTNGKKIISKLRIEGRKTRRYKGKNGRKRKKKKIRPSLRRDVKGRCN